MRKTLRRWLKSVWRVVGVFHKAMPPALMGGQWTGTGFVDAYKRNRLYTKSTNAQALFPPPGATVYTQNRQTNTNHLGRLFQPGRRLFSLDRLPPSVTLARMGRTLLRQERPDVPRPRVRPQPPPAVQPRRRCACPKSPTPFHQKTPRQATAPAADGTGTRGELSRVSRFLILWHEKSRFAWPRSGKPVKRLT